jgi:hypothetical protein
MRYVTSFERLAMAEGRQEGIQQGILHAILSMFSLRFPQVDVSLYMDRFKSIGEAKMAEYGLRIATAKIPEEVFAQDDSTKD